MSHVERFAGKLFASILVVSLHAAPGCSSSAKPDADTSAASTPPAGTLNEVATSTPRPDSDWVPRGDVVATTSRVDAGGATTAPTSGTVFGAGDVTVKFVDVDAYRAAIEQHKGKVVLVDFWATWCAQCMEDFPHSVELARKWKDKGLDVVSVSFDESGDHPKTLDFLTKQRAAFENLMSLHGLSAESFVAFDIIGGALPYYKLYDRGGKLRYQFTGNVDEFKELSNTKELNRRVEELLAEGA